MIFVNYGCLLIIILSVAGSLAQRFGSNNLNFGQSELQQQGQGTAVVPRWGTRRPRSRLRDQHQSGQSRNQRARQSDERIERQLRQRSGAQRQRCSSGRWNFQSASQLQTQQGQQRQRTEVMPVNNNGFNSGFGNKHRRNDFRDDDGDNFDGARATTIADARDRSAATTTTDLTGTTTASGPGPRRNVNNNPRFAGGNF
ncbi:hypothetical protein BV898_10932 [Hypsibius exemplaris]|uniref:Uncharacterized protein n=1 Tax=Hypsibius exemplaris TaxID=2072580 RepID=A0A1W0WI61_HYPEX|nr:hypothetical protein BV898_10932 [Hypsibius exemplaris]